MQSLKRIWDNIYSSDVVLAWRLSVAFSLWVSQENSFSHCRNFSIKIGLCHHGEAQSQSPQASGAAFTTLAQSSGCWIRSLAWQAQKPGVSSSGEDSHEPSSKSGSVPSTSQDQCMYRCQYRCLKYHVLESGEHITLAQARPPWLEMFDLSPRK